MKRSHRKSDSFIDYLHFVFNKESELPKKMWENKKMIHSGTERFWLISFNQIWLFSHKNSQFIWMKTKAEKCCRSAKNKLLFMSIFFFAHENLVKISSTISAWRIANRWILNLKISFCLPEHKNLLIIAITWVLNFPRRISGNMNSIWK